MEFKIEVKPTYSIIQAAGGKMDVELATALQNEIKELLQNNAQNFIVDLKNQLEMDVEAGSILMEMHHELYENGHSIVFINSQDALLATMKKEQLHISLNLSPTLIEAIDIVSMEIMERDILNES